MILFSLGTSAQGASRSKRSSSSLASAGPPEEEVETSRASGFHLWCWSLLTQATPDPRAMVFRGIAFGDLRENSVPQERVEEVPWRSSGSLLRWVDVAMGRRPVNCAMCDPSRESVSLCRFEEHIMWLRVRKKLGFRW